MKRQIHVISRKPAYDFTSTLEFMEFPPLVVVDAQKS